VDYGMGNIRSIESALKYLGVENIILSNDIDELDSADKLILPGVGSFSKAMENIRRLGLDTTLEKEAMQKKQPILGICLGMQMMAESSDEGGENIGLGFIRAKVTRFNEEGLKVPHVGFNQVSTPKSSRLYQDMDNLNDFYFTHSYYMSSADDINQGLCEYGEEFIVSYEVGNIAGVQFHPELSQTNGLKLIENFLKSF